jgi:Uma2 family endonuclease
MERIREDQKADLIDGVIYLASPENAEHNDLLRWLTIILGQYIEERNLGQLTINRVAYRLSDRSAPEPDLAFVAEHRLDRMKEGYVDGPPDLAVEIVSPDSIHRDYEDKRRQYEAAGVREYWIIDPSEKTATFLVFENGALKERFPERNVFRSRVLPGFQLDIRWLWQRPLPSTRPIVQRLLGESPSQTG